MYRRRFPLETAVKRPPEPFNNANAYNSLEHKYPSHYPNFLSHQSTHLLHSTYNAHLRTVAELAFGSAATFSQAQKELFRIVEAAERGEGRLRNPRLLHHASQAWNLEFFLRGLTCKETTPSDSVLNILSRDFGSFDNFQRTFQAHASAMIGCGWIWLVKQDRDAAGEVIGKDLILRKESMLSILTTFNGASPLFKTDANSNSQSKSSTHISTVTNSPILGLNLWESAFILDYGVDRDRYVSNWWKAINWNLASVLLTK